MITHNVHLLRSETCGDLVGRFFFERPDGYTFVAGQHLTLSLSVAGAAARHVFTIASTPADDHIEICTRLSGSDYKKALLAAGPGSSFEISDASGRLRLRPHATTGFLVGGVGVTPARSLVADAISGDGDERIVLFYGDRSPDCMSYAVEFEELAAGSDRLVYVPVVEHPDAAWTGETGYITAEMVRRYVPDPGDMGWIISGPPVMVDVMNRLADELGVLQEDRQVELFSGYPSTE